MNLKIGVLKDFAKFTGKHLCQRGSFMNTIFYETPPVAASVANNFHVKDQFDKLIWVKVLKYGPSLTSTNFTWFIFESLDPFAASCST